MNLTGSVVVPVPTIVKLSGLIVPPDEGPHVPSPRNTSLELPVKPIPITSPLDRRTIRESEEVRVAEPGATNLSSRIVPPTCRVCAGDATLIPSLYFLPPGPTTNT